MTTPALIISDTSHDNSYDCRDLSDRFQLMLEGLDFQNTLDALKVTKWNPLKRKKVLRELRALSVALWKLALKKSFPDLAEHCFKAYLSNRPANRRSVFFVERINTYAATVQNKGDSDFYEVASYLADIFTLGAGDQKRLRLQLSLDIRKLYNIIFEHLI